MSDDARLLDDIQTLVREADDEHFYGAWRRGGAVSGGAMAKQKARQRTASERRASKGPDIPPRPSGIPDAEWDEYVAAKTAYAKKPSAAAKQRYERARMAATASTWKANPKPPAPPKYPDQKAAMALAQKLPTPTTNDVRVRLKAMYPGHDVKVAWVSKPKPFIAGHDNLPGKQGEVRVEVPGYKPRTMPVMTDETGAIIVGTPWNTAAMSLVPLATQAIQRGTALAGRGLAWAARSR